MCLGKGYQNNGLFILNVSSDNKEGSSSSAYMVESLDIWHGRLGHVNVPYILKLKERILINKLDNTNLNKCEIFVETKITKKPSKQVTRQSELLELVHSDVGVLKYTMTRSRKKKFYIIFMDDYSKYTKLCLLRSKDQAFEIFDEYKSEVENQLDRKIKRLRIDRGGKYKSSSSDKFCQKNGIIDEVTPLYLLESNDIVERKNRALKEMMNALLASSDLPASMFGGLFFLHVIYKIGFLAINLVK